MPSALIADPRSNCKHVGCYNAIASLVSVRTGETEIERPELAKMTGLSLNTLDCTLRDLQEWEWIDVHARPGKRSLYRLLPARPPRGLEEVPARPTRDPARPPRDPARPPRDPARPPRGSSSYGKEKEKEREPNPLASQFFKQLRQLTAFKSLPPEDESPEQFEERRRRTLEALSRPDPEPETAETAEPDHQDVPA